MFLKNIQMLPILAAGLGKPYKFKRQHEFRTKLILQAMFADSLIQVVNLVEKT